MGTQSSFGAAGGNIASQGFGFQQNSNNTPTKPAAGFGGAASFGYPPAFGSPPALGHQQVLELPHQWDQHLVVEEEEDPHLAVFLAILQPLEVQPVHQLL